MSAERCVRFACDCGGFFPFFQYTGPNYDASATRVDIKRLSQVEREQKEKLKIINNRIERLKHQEEKYQILRGLYTML